MCCEVAGEVQFYVGKLEHWKGDIGVKNQQK